MSDSQIIVGLEKGTSKVCAVLGEVSGNQEANIIGLGSLNLVEYGKEKL